MLYTRKGDGGTSGTFGTNERLPKDSPVFEALGALDELNSLLGLCRARASLRADTKLNIPREILNVQETLFIAQAELAGSTHRILQIHIDALEGAIDMLEPLIEKPHSFVISGASEASALFDVARTVCRRAERAIVRLGDPRRASPALHAYMNRLSSLLYALARYTAQEEGAIESAPVY